MIYGIDYHFTQSSPGAGLDQKAATLHAQGVTALSFANSSNIDTVSTDTVNLSSDLSAVTGGTTSTQLTSSLAKILQSATFVDSATGSREISAGVSQALGTQLGKLLTQSGFSQADANAASKSLVDQLSSASKSIAVSLTSSANTAGSYTGALSGGQENSTWSAQSTTALSISFDPAHGNLSVKLDQHQISASNISWGSATQGDVSIALTQAELQPISFMPIGTTTSAIGSAIQHTQTTVYGNSSIPNEFGASNVEGDLRPAQGTNSTGQPKLAGLNDLLALQNGLSQATSTDIASTTSIGKLDGAGIASTSVSTGNKAAQQATDILKAILKQMHDATISSSVSLTGMTNVGTLILNSDRTKSLTYNRPSGDQGLVNLPSINVNA